VLLCAVAHASSLAFPQARAQLVSKLPALKVPTTHSWQESPFLPPNPALQVQSVCSLLAGGACELPGHVKHVPTETAPGTAEYFPATQSSQSIDPVLALYFPATHGTQFVPSAPVAPALQVQSVILTLAAGALDAVGHDWHAWMEIAPDDAK